jgi:hypothetical protein
MRHSRLPAAVALLALVAALLPAPPATAQCAMCKTALTNSEEGRGLTAEFNRAILVMLLGPYLLMAAGAGYLLRGRIRSLTARAAVRVRLPRRRPAFRA